MLSNKERLSGKVGGLFCSSIFDDIYTSRIYGRRGDMMDFPDDAKCWVVHFETKSLGSTCRTLFNVPKRMEI